MPGLLNYTKSPMGYQTGGLYIPTSTRVGGHHDRLSRLFEKDYREKAETAKAQAGRLGAWSQGLGSVAKGLGTAAGTWGLKKLAGGSLAKLATGQGLKTLFAGSNPLALAAIIGGPALLSYVAKMAPYALDKNPFTGKKIARPEDVESGFEVDGRTSQFRSGEYKELSDAMASERSYQKEKFATQAPGEVWSTLTNYGKAALFAGAKDMFSDKLKKGTDLATGSGIDQTQISSVQEIPKFSHSDKSLEGLERFATNKAMGGGSESFFTDDMMSEKEFFNVPDNLGKNVRSTLTDTSYADDAQIVQEYGNIPEPTLAGSIKDRLSGMKKSLGDRIRAAATPIPPLTTDRSYVHPSLKMGEYPHIRNPFREGLLSRIFPEGMNMPSPQYRQSGYEAPFNPLNWLSEQEITNRANFVPRDPFKVVQQASEAVIPAEVPTTLYNAADDPNIIFDSSQINPFGTR